MRDKPCHREAIVSLKMATATYTAAVCKFGGGQKSFWGLGSILGSIFGFNIGFNIGCNIGLNIGFNIWVQYWV